MRNMSFALTTEQLLDGRKTVTRRLGWEKLKPGELVQPVRKCMGLKKGEKLEKLGPPIRIVSVRRERLDLMNDDVRYGLEECRREGFGDHPIYRWPSEFVNFFCSTHRPCEPTWHVTRIEFERLQTTSFSPPTGEST